MLIRAYTVSRESANALNGATVPTGLLHDFHGPPRIIMGDVNIIPEASRVGNLAKDILVVTESVSSQPTAFYIASAGARCGHPPNTDEAHARSRPQEIP